MRGVINSITAVAAARVRLLWLVVPDVFELLFASPHIINFTGHPGNMGHTTDRAFGSLRERYGIHNSLLSMLLVILGLDSGLECNNLPLEVLLLVESHTDMAGLGEHLEVGEVVNVGFDVVDSGDGGVDTPVLLLSLGFVASDLLHDLLDIGLGESHMLRISHGSVESLG